MGHDLQHNYLYNSARWCVYKAFREWLEAGLLPELASGDVAMPVGKGGSFSHRFPSRLDDYIARVCGYHNVADMQMNWRDETNDLFRLLIGPNGYAIFKALKARKEAADV